MSINNRQRLKRRPGSRLHFLKTSERILLHDLLKAHVITSSRMFTASDVWDVMELYEVLGGDPRADFACVFDPENCS